MHGHGKQGWAAAWAFVSFFLVLSLLTPWALAQGWGMSGLFFAMVGAASVAYLVPFVVKLFVRRLAQQGIGLREWGIFMAGGSPETLFVEAGSTPSTSLVPYEEQDDETDDEESGWDAGAEEEDEEASQEAAMWSPAPASRPGTPAITRSQQRPTSSIWTPRDAWEGEGDLLDLAPNLQVHPDTLFGGRVLVAGMPGSGKTNTMRLIIEQSGTLGLPFLLIDTDGEHASLLPYLPSGVLVGGYNRVPVPASRYTTITRPDALFFGEHVLAEGWQVIVDVKSYEERPGHPDEAMAAQVFMDMIAGMRAWAEARPPRERIPSMIFLEEAQVWLPQQPMSSPLDRRTLRDLQALFFRSARDGRRRGIGLVLIAHRIAGIHKEVLMCDWLILHQPQATDLKRYCELAPTVHRERFQRLSRGKAIVVSPGGTQQVTFHSAHSQDQGVTPGLPALRRYQERAQGAASSEARDFPLMRPRPTAAPAPETRLPGQGQHAGAMVPGAAEVVRFSHTARTPSDLTQETVQGEAGTPTPLPAQHVSTGQFTYALSPEVQRALEAWQHGHQSVDKLKAVLGVTHHKAYRLYRELKARHLIA
jgi:hypothetical protein